MGASTPSALLLGAGPITHLLTQLAGNSLAGFILVLARVTPLFILAPPFSSTMIPPRVRGVIAVGISIGLAPIAMHGQHVPSDALALAGLVIAGGLVGLAFAFSFAVLFGAIEAAGSLADLGAGFSYGSLIDPFNGTESGVFSTFYSLLGVTIFLVIGGEAWVLRGLARTFQLVPLTSAPRLSSLVSGAEQVFVTIFASAVEIAAPVLIALLITDAAFGVISRVIPQLNVFAVGFPAKVAVAILIVGASIPFVGGFVSSQLSTSVSAALGALRVG
jgi:flagellar biosynthetic protein FliR